jgi:hypothetical protein
VEHFGSGPDDETFVTRKSGFSEPAMKASAEIHVFPPGGFEGRVEAAESLPHRAAHQPCSGGRLCDGNGSTGRRRECRRTGCTEGQVGSLWKASKLPSVLGLSVEAGKQRHDTGRSRPVVEEIDQSFHGTRLHVNVGIEKQQQRFRSLRRAAAGGESEASVFCERHDLDIGIFGCETLGASVA